MKQKRYKRIFAFLTSVCVLAGSAYGPVSANALGESAYTSVTTQESGSCGADEIIKNGIDGMFASTKQSQELVTTGSGEEATKDTATTQVLTTEPNTSVSTTAANSEATTEGVSNAGTNTRMITISKLQYSALEVSAGTTLKISAQGVIDVNRIKDAKAEFTFATSDNKNIKVDMLYSPETNCLEGEVLITEDMSKGIYALQYIKFTDNTTGVTCQYAITNVQLSTFQKIDGTEADAKIEKISLSAQSLNMKVNSSKKLVATTVPENTSEELLWSSSDSGVVSVSQEGMVTAKKEGTATVSVKSKNNTDVIASCKVTVAEDLVIVLDPGHGNKDVGAVNRSQGLYERDVNLEIAKACRDYLEQYEGVTVFLTRETNKQFLGLEERTKFAKACDADVFISLHNNASISKRMTGSEVWVTRSTYKAKYNKAMKSLGNKILTQLSKVGIKKRGVYTRASSHLRYSFDGSRADYYAVIRGSIERDIPAMIIEHGYIDSSDYRFMNSKAKTKKLGVADAKAIVKYYGLTKRTDTENAIEVGGIKLNCNDSVLTIKKNASFKLKATIAPNNAEDKSVTYSTSNSKIVTVGSSGNVKAKKKGSATITCKAKDSGGMTKKLKVTVK